MTGQGYISISQNQWEFYDSIQKPSVLGNFVGSEVTVVDSYSRPGIFATPPHFFRNLRQNRNLLKNMIARDFKNTYHGHFLGYIWSLLEPLAFTGIFVLVLLILRNEPDNLMPLRIMLGILIYTAFSKTVSASTVSLTRNSALIQQIYFPREILTSSIAGFQMIRLVLSLFIVVPYMVYVSLYPSYYIFLLPISGICAILLGNGLGMIFAIIHVRLRDLEQIVTLVIRLGFYLSGVFFSAELIPKAYIPAYFLNPVAVYIEMSRTAITGDIGVLNSTYILQAVISSLLVYLLGMIVFKRFERKAVLYL